jgi:hypothetical protein
VRAARACTRVTEWLASTERTRRRGVYPQLVRQALHSFLEPLVADACGLPMRTIKGLRGGRSPRAATLRSLVGGLAQLCRGALRDAKLEAASALAALATWRDRPTEEPKCPSCGATPPPGRTYCMAACRQAAYRRRW